MIEFARARHAVAVLLATVLGWSACPALGQGGSPGEGAVTVDGVQRDYLVHVPPNVARPAPVVFLFHGGGGRPEGFARRTGMNELADKNGFVAVYPAGTETPSGRGGTWNVGGAESRTSADDVAFVRAILHDLEQTLPIDRARIYAAGHSMGGVFTYRLACEMSDTFAAIAAVSATMVEPSCHPSSPVAVLHIHGSDDDRIPIKGGHGAMTALDRSWPAPQQGIAFWSQYDNCTGQQTRAADGSTSCTTYGQCRATVEYCVIAGGEHPWPDGASDRIWAFFAGHRKNAS